VLRWSKFIQDKSILINGDWNSIAQAMQVVDCQLTCEIRRRRCEACSGKDTFQIFLRLIVKITEPPGMGFGFSVMLLRGTSPEQRKHALDATP
jgi:hypothetical protein